MSKFVQDPFARQIRSAIQGDTVGIRLSAILSPLAEVSLIQVAAVGISVGMAAILSTVTVTASDQMLDLIDVPEVVLAKAANADTSLVATPSNAAVEEGAALQQSPILTRLAEAVNLGIV